jgi:hypothetical protein
VEEAKGEAVRAFSEVFSMRFEEVSFPAPGEMEHDRDI